MLLRRQAQGWLALLAGGTLVLTRGLWLRGWPSFVVLCLACGLIGWGSWRVLRLFVQQLPVADKVSSLARALWSFARWGDVPLIRYETRRVTCEQCPQLRITSTGYFCGACACPQWAGSDLRSKWRMADLKCPQGRWQ